MHFLFCKKISYKDKRKRIYTAGQNIKANENIEKKYFALLDETPNLNKVSKNEKNKK